MDPFTTVAVSTVVRYGVPKIVEFSLPKIKKASTVMVRMIPHKDANKDSEEKTAEPEQQCKHIKLSHPLRIIQHDMNIPSSFSENQMQRIKHEAGEDYAKIAKAQNEIMFLSNSIEYFLKSHLNRYGIDRGISYALQYDMQSVTNHLKDTRGLRFPGYLLHQCKCLSESIEEYNLLYDAILNDGHVTSWNEKKAEEELGRTYGIDKRESIVKDYIPYKYRIPWKREASKEGENSKKWMQIFKSNKEHVNEEAYDELYILAGELTANENLEEKIRKRLENTKGKRIILDSNPTNQDE